MIKVNPFETYKSYLGLKNHFTRENYDYHKYCGKSRASLKSFYRRKDRMFFERLSRQKKDNEVLDFFVSNFVSTTDPQTLWIGEIMRNGEKEYTDWKRKVQSLSYVFRDESENIFSSNKVDDVFDCSDGHPIILKMFLNDEVSIETMVIYDKILKYTSDFDKKLKDPVWETVSLKIKKYSSFLNIDVNNYKKILKKIILD
tara:strand:- start:111 stop:710 length:600 start_codon:yes stop_codon:yes gene_type:complete